MKPHRKTEAEYFESIRQAAEEMLDEAWEEAGEAMPDPALRDRVTAEWNRQKHRKKHCPRSCRWGQIAAMLVLTVGVILFCIPTVRAGFVNAVVTWYDAYFQVEFNPSTDKTAEVEAQAMKAMLTVVPEGYILRSNNNVGSILSLTYENEAGEHICVKGYTDTVTALYDDDFLMEEVRVGQFSGYYLYQPGETETAVTWGEGRMVYTVFAYSPEITKQQLIQMAEGLK